MAGPAVTFDEFVGGFPVFRNAPETVVLAKIKEAACLLDQGVWGKQWCIGVKYKAAQLLARDPYGRKMKLVSADGSTPFDITYNDLALANGLGCGRVI